MGKIMMILKVKQNNSMENKKNILLIIFSFVVIIHITGIIANYFYYKYRIKHNIYNGLSENKRKKNFMISQITFIFGLFIFIILLAMSWSSD
jgi:heme/copper-type cytochrome/quinol oxidase subunit 2